MSRQSEAQKRVQARLKAQKEKQAKDTPRVNRRGRRLSVKNRVLPAEMVGAISPEEMAKIVKEIRTESKESKPAAKTTTSKSAAKPTPKPTPKPAAKPAASKPTSAPKSDKKRKSIAETLKELKKMKRASKERQGKEPKMQGVGPYRSAKKYTAKMAGQPAKPAQAAKPNTKSKLRQAMEERMKKRRGRGY